MLSRKKAEKSREILTGVEIGTNTIKVVMGELLPDGVLAVVGVGEANSLHVVKGEIDDVSVVQEQLERALAMAEKNSGLEIGELFLAVSGGHVRCVNSIGSTMVASPDRKIHEDDKARAARNAHAYSLPPDRIVLHFFDRYYRIDGTRDVLNPLGLIGAKLEADVHIIYGQFNRVESNRRMLVDVMGYDPAGIAFSGVASAYAALAPDEAERGALVIDIGAGVTEYVVFHGPGCYHSGQFAIGTEHIANDLSLGLRLPVARCRKILHDLQQLGSCVMIPDGRARIMGVESLGQPPRRVPISSVEMVIDMRLRELFEIILADLRANDALSRIGSGVRLCGGGAQLHGIVRLAQDVFDQMPVSVAKPRLMSGTEDVLKSPRFMTPLGLIRWGAEELARGPRVPRSFQGQVKAELQKAADVVRRAIRW